MTDEEFAELLKLEHELSGVEFKSPGLRTDRTLINLVARAVMGMANRRDGGRVVVGVREESGKLDRVGLTEAEVESWRYDLVADVLAPMADPPVGFDIEVHRVDGRDFILIEVREFEDVPVICRRNYPRSLRAGQKAILRDGAVYVRPRRKPETTEIAGQTEMRDLLELATEKRLRQVIGTVSRAGGAVEGRPSADEAFTNELAPEFR